MQILGSVTPRMRPRVRTGATVLLLGGAYLASPLGAALADDTAEDLKQLRAAIQRELGDLKKREQKLHQEFLRLDQKSHCWMISCGSCGRPEWGRGLRPRQTRSE